MQLKRKMALVALSSRTCTCGTAPRAATSDHQYYLHRRRKGGLYSLQRIWSASIESCCNASRIAPGYTVLNIHSSNIEVFNQVWLSFYIRIAPAYTVLAVVSLCHFSKYSLLHSCLRRTRYELRHIKSLFPTHPTHSALSIRPFLDPTSHTFS